MDLGETGLTGLACRQCLQLFRELAVCVTRLVLGDPAPWGEVLREELKLK